MGSEHQSAMMATTGPIINQKAPGQNPAPPAPIWSPADNQCRASQLYDFIQYINKHEGLRLHSWKCIHDFAEVCTEEFWMRLWDYCALRGDKGPEPWLTDEDDVAGGKFFMGGGLNFTDNLLHGAALTGDPDAEALVGYREQQCIARISWRDLRRRVARWQRYLLSTGLQPGDRVAALLPNIPEAVIAMLAVASIGGVWVALGPEFGSTALVDRLQQTKPVVLIAADGSWRRGRPLPLADKLSQVLAGVPALKQLIVVDYINAASDDNDTVQARLAATGWPGTVTCARAIESDSENTNGSDELTVRWFRFDHPLYVLFTSGTSGKAKALLHGAGGTLIQHVKEHRLHCDIRPGDRLFYATSPAWMMWHWLVSSLASGATLVLYDGAFDYPGPTSLFDLAERERLTLFGTSAALIRRWRQAGVNVQNSHDLSALKLMTSTGSPLSAAQFEYVYDALIPARTQLVSMSGGSDIISCFVLGNPLRPVYAGECQASGLGMAIDVVADNGRHLPAGQKGELVCKKAFPSRPLGFLNDPDKTAFHASYFSRFPGMWRQGDFAEWTEHGGLVIHGRSDGVLNRQGVRIGSAEINLPVEQLPEIVMAMAIAAPGTDREKTPDDKIILFVVLASGISLTPDVRDKINAHLRDTVSPRHVPDDIHAVPDLPRTWSGKISHAAISAVLNGNTPTNLGALQNPEVLAHFRQFRPTA